MKVYRLTPNGAKKLKQLWTISALSYVIPSIGIFAFSMLYRGGTKQDVLIFLAIAILIVAAYFFAKRKQFPVIDSVRLVIADDNVTYHVSNKPDIVIAYNDVRKITTRKHGIFLVNNNPANKSLPIGDYFESFKEIVENITARVDNYNLQAISDMKVTQA